MRKSEVTKKNLASIMPVIMIMGILIGVGISNTETVKAEDYGIRA